MYNIIYNGEVIDTAADYNEAKYLQEEYNMAFHTTNTKIKKVK